MKRIILSRDEGDKEISNWLVSLGFDIRPVTEKMDSWIDGLVIGGGSDPGIPKDLDRDAMENELIESAVKERIPILGICRGAEVITVWAGGELVPLSNGMLLNHRSTWHTVFLSGQLWNGGSINVWSHHHLNIKSPGKMDPVAFAQDGTIEAISDTKRKILGVMWHPERSANDSITGILPWLKWIEKRF